MNQPITFLMFPVNVITGNYRDVFHRHLLHGASSYFFDAKLKGPFDVLLLFRVVMPTLLISLCNLSMGPMAVSLFDVCGFGKNNAKSTSSPEMNAIDKIVFATMPELNPRNGSNTCSASWNDNMACDSTAMMPHACCSWFWLAC